LGFSFESVLHFFLDTKSEQNDQDDLNPSIPLFALMQKVEQKNQAISMRISILLNFSFDEIAGSP
jgi:hypothetical protein